jgi:putative addiction module CopG family antidote
MPRAVTLSERADAFVEAQVAAGVYPSADALVEAALDLLRSPRPLDAILQEELDDAERNGAVELDEVLADLDRVIEAAR